MHVSIYTYTSVPVECWRSRPTSRRLWTFESWWWRCYCLWRRCATTAPCTADPPGNHQLNKQLRLCLMMTNCAALTSDRLNHVLCVACAVSFVGSYGGWCCQFVCTSVINDTRRMWAITFWSQWFNLSFSCGVIWDVVNSPSLGNVFYKAMCQLFLFCSLICMHYSVSLHTIYVSVYKVNIFVSCISLHALYGLTTSSVFIRRECSTLNAQFVSCQASVQVNYFPMINDRFEGRAQFLKRMSVLTLKICIDINVRFQILRINI